MVWKDGTGAGPHLAAAGNRGIPGIAAIQSSYVRALDDVGKSVATFTLIYAGGIRNGGDVAKALALGADAVADRNRSFTDGT